MAAFLVASAWVGFVLSAMVGWGTLITHWILRLPHRFDWARSASLGLAFGACIGGVFDLAAIVSRWLVIGFLGVGAGGFLWRIGRRPLRVPRITTRVPVPTWTRLVIAGVVVLLAVRVAGAVITLQPQRGMRLGSFNTFDDFQAYIVYPLKMLETGSVGWDPFSVRRTSAVAFDGNAFLQTFVLAALPVQSLRALDVSVGTIVVAGLLWGYARRLRVPSVARWLIVFVFLAVPPPLINVTAVIIPLALFISLFLLLEDDALGRDPLSRAALIGVTVAAISVLKTSLAPAALAWLGAACAVSVFHASSRRGALLECASWCTAALAAIIPSLLDSFRWTHTLIPTRLDAYFADPSYVMSVGTAREWHSVLRHLKELPALPYGYVTALAGVLALRPFRLRTPDAFWSLFAAAILGSGAVIVAIGGTVNNPYRLMYAFVMSATLIALVQTVAALAAWPRKNAARLAFAVTGVATALVLFPTTRLSVGLYRFNLATLRRVAAGGQFVDSDVIARYRRLQRVVPEHAVMLERMDYPFLFDFRRNTVLVDDIPGLASIAPGEPFFKGAEPLASYLVANGVRYVAYDYKSEAASLQSRRMPELANDDRNPVGQALARLILDFRQDLIELSCTRRRIFDDGAAFVLDLASPAS